MPGPLLAGLIPMENRQMMLIMPVSFWVFSLSTISSLQISNTHFIVALGLGFAKVQTLQSAVLLGKKTKTPRSELMRITGSLFFGLIKKENK